MSVFGVFVHEFIVGHNEWTETNADGIDGNICVNVSCVEKLHSVDVDLNFVVKNTPFKD